MGAADAARARAAEGRQRRVDPTDGQAYTRAEFVEFYGGTREWDQATPERLPALPPGALSELLGRLPELEAAEASRLAAEGGGEMEGEGEDEDYYDEGEEVCVCTLPLPVAGPALAWP